MSDNPIIYSAKWIDAQHIECPKCHALLSIDVSKRFNQMYETAIKMYESQIEHLIERIKTYEDEEKIGRYTLMNDNDVICHSDEHKVIYEYAVECIKNGGNPKEMMVIDKHREGHGNVNSIVQFLWVWGY